MKSWLLGIVVLATAWQVDAACYTCNVNNTPYKGIVYTQILTHNEEARIPRWNPAMQVPLISMLDAIQNVRLYLEEKFPDDKWTYSGLRLNKFGDYETGNVENSDNWWYGIQFCSNTEFIRDSVPFYFVIHIASDGWIPAMTPDENTSHFGVFDGIRDNRP